ncbi:MAG: Holliday junction resolvase RuvX [Chloroflexota bacterium]|nr:Holliday junction resolvase RuvX [Chloroflexota bacterium]
MSRVIGLDHGSRRIGVAVGDTETWMAFERAAIVRRSLAADLAAVEALVVAEGAELVVIGLPLNMDGTEGGQAASARKFGERLVALGLRIAHEDERLSSWEAGERLREAGRQPRRASGELDSTAARLILQQYLDVRRSAGGPEEIA